MSRVDVQTVRFTCNGWYRVPGDPSERMCFEDIDRLEWEQEFGIPSNENHAFVVITGTPGQIQELFYRRGWTVPLTATDPSGFGTIDPLVALSHLCPRKHYE